MKRAYRKIWWTIPCGLGVAMAVFAMVRTEDLGRSTDLEPDQAATVENGERSLRMGIRVGSFRKTELDSVDARALHRLKQAEEWAAARLRVAEDQLHPHISEKQGSNADTQKIKIRQRIQHHLRTHEDSKALIDTQLQRSSWE